MKKELKDKHFINKPEYQGGVKAMQAFLAKNKRYPKKALKKQIEGTVHMRYTIDHKGRVVKVKVIAGIGHGCDEEAKRIVKLLKFNVPPTRKMRVQYHKTIHIHFKLPKKKKHSTKIAYSTSPEKSDVSTASEASKKKSYHYQIKW